MATGSNKRGNPTEPMPQGLFVVLPPILLLRPRLFVGFFQILFYYLIYGVNRL